MLHASINMQTRTNLGARFSDAANAARILLPDLGIRRKKRNLFYTSLPVFRSAGPSCLQPHRHNCWSVLA